MDADNNRPKRILGLKAIAEYLRTSPRNIYRWEKELGFPLHRIGGSKGRSVFVDIDELEDWLKKTDLSAQNKVKRPKFLTKIRHPLRWRIVSIPIAVLIIIFIQLILITRRDSSFINPVTYNIDGKIVILKDNQDNFLWNYQAWSTVINEDAWIKNPRIDLADIDGDGFNEVIAAPYDQETNQYSLTLYEHQGKIIWSKKIKTEISFQGLRFVKDFIPITTQFCRSRDGSWVIVTSWRHNVRFVSTVMTISTEGKIISEFTNPGHLSRILITDVDNDGEKEILFSGTHNLLNGDGILVVLPLVGY